LAAGLRPDPLRDLTALPRPLAVSKDRRAGDGNEREMERKGTIRSKEKREITGNGGELGIMKYVSRIVEVRYWQPYRLAPLKNVLAPLWPPHAKKSWRRHCRCGHFLVTIYTS